MAQTHKNLDIPHDFEDSIAKPVLELLLMIGWPLIASPAIGSAVSSAKAVSVDDLFAIFVDLRSPIVFDQSNAQYEDPRFYSRLTPKPKPIRGLK